MIASSATAGQPARPSRPGQLALVHLRVLGQPRLLGVLGDDAVERLDVLERATHQHGVVDALAVVAEHPHLGGRVRHGAQLGQPLAAEPDRHRADGAHVDQAGHLAQAPDLLDDARGVGDGGGVGHGVHARVAAERGRREPGQHGLGVLATGLAQVGVQVDEAGQGDEPVGVDDVAARPMPAGASSVMTPSDTTMSTASSP